MIMATFRDIPGYEGRYQISDEGEVKSLARTVPAPHGREAQVRERILKPQSHFKGYICYFLCKENAQRKFFVHRLVALAFIPNPENKPFVNHKDLNKVHNRLENLEWATESENTQHYYDNAKNDEPF